MKKIILVFSLLIILGNIQAQWIHLNGPANRYTYCFLDSGNKIFAGTGWGVFTSADSGKTWISSSNGMPYPKINKFLKEGQDIYAATDSGIYKSVDNGLNWIPKSHIYPFLNVRDLASFQTYILASFSSSVYVSLDYCNNWYLIPDLMNKNVTSFAVQDTSLFAGSDGNGIYISNDGSHFSQVNNGLSNTHVRSMLVTDTTIYAVTQGGIFSSSDLGANWHSLYSGMTTAMAIKEKIMILGTWGNGTFIFENPDLNWKSINEGLLNTYILSLAIIGNDVYAGTDGNGICKRSLNEITGLPDHKDNDIPFRLYPNPGNGKIFIEFPGGLYSNPEIEIYNLYGKKINHSLISIQQWIFETDLSSYLPGIYIVKLTKGEKIYSYKIVIQ